MNNHDLSIFSGSKSLPLHYMMPSNSFHGSVPGEHFYPRENFYSRDEEYIRTVRSSSVILGAVCGIIGFLIINVTIVMAVRKYSHRQMRRRRILEIELVYHYIFYVLIWFSSFVFCDAVWYILSTLAYKNIY